MNAISNRKTLKTNSAIQKTISIEERQLELIGWEREPDTDGVDIWFHRKCFNAFTFFSTQSAIETSTKLVKLFKTA